MTASHMVGRDEWWQSCAVQVRIPLGRQQGLHLPPTPLQPPLGLGATRDRVASPAMGSRVRGDSSSKASVVVRCTRCLTAPSLHQLGTDMCACHISSPQSQLGCNHNLCDTALRAKSHCLNVQGAFASICSVMLALCLTWLSATSCLLLCILD